MNVQFKSTTSEFGSGRLNEFVQRFQLLLSSSGSLPVPFSTLGCAGMTIYYQTFMISVPGRIVAALAC
jgi:hypothetical protein